MFCVLLTGCPPRGKTPEPPTPGPAGTNTVSSTDATGGGGTGGTAPLPPAYPDIETVTRRIAATLSTMPALRRAEPTRLVLRPATGSVLEVAEYSQRLRSGLAAALPSHIVLQGFDAAPAGPSYTLAPVLGSLPASEGPRAGEGALLQIQLSDPNGVSLWNTTYRVQRLARW